LRLNFNDKVYRGLFSPPPASFSMITDYRLG